MSLEKNHSVFIFSVSGLIFCHYGYQDVSLTLMQKDYMVKNTSWILWIIKKLFNKSNVGIVFINF